MEAELNILISAIEKAQQRGVYTLTEVSTILKSIGTLNKIMSDMSLTKTEAEW